MTTHRHLQPSSNQIAQIHQQNAKLPAQQTNSPHHRTKKQIFPTNPAAHTKHQPINLSIQTIPITSVFLKKNKN